uniref:Putative monolaris n=1 Tax=Rhipicephalus pulchellus TaxID=72859 RepID=L7LTS9_RHIPC
MRFTSFAFIAFYTTFFIPKNGNAVSTRVRCNSMPDQDGDCDSHIDKWYYSKVDGKCLTFMYGDCPQNENVFPTEQECLDTCQNALKGPSGPSKGSKGHRRPPKPRGSSEETVGGGAGRSGEGGSEEGGTRNPPVKAPKPTRPGGRHKPRPPTGPKWKPPAVTRKRPPPTKQKRPGKADCGVRAKSVYCNQDYTGMWFYVGQFGTCSRVQPGQCPTHGSFFPTCEECMHKCHRAWEHRCEVMQRRYKQ